MIKNPDYTEHIFVSLCLSHIQQHTSNTKTDPCDVEHTQMLSVTLTPNSQSPGHGPLG